MIKYNEKFDETFKKMQRESKYKYFVVGSPTNLRKSRIVEADTFEDLWDELMDIGEIDEERLDADCEYEDEDGNFYREFDKDYDEMIEEYLSTGNDFYYSKLSWLEDIEIDDEYIKMLLDKGVVDDVELEDILESEEILEWEKEGNSYELLGIDGKKYSVEVNNIE